MAKQLGYEDLRLEPTQDPQLALQAAGGQEVVQKASEDRTGRAAPQATSRRAAGDRVLRGPVSVGEEQAASARDARE